MPSSASFADLAEVLDEIDASSIPGHTGGVRDSPVRSEESFAHVQSPSREVHGLPSSLEGESPNSNLLSDAVITASQIDKKYHLWQAPATFEDSCFRLIGEGGSFCISQGCRVAHKSTKHFHPLPGEIYVKKNPSMAFIDPSIPSSSLRQELISSWFNTSCTIVEWNQRFSLAKHEQRYPVLRKPDEKISEGDIKAKKVLLLSTMAFKTPAKKRKVSDSELQLDLPQLSVLNNPIEGLTPQLEPINRKLLLVAEALQKLYLMQQKDFGTSVEGLHQSDVRLSKLEQEFGSPPQDLDEKFQAPNIWLTLGSLAEYLKALHDEVATSIHNKQLVGEMEVMSSQLHELNIFSVDAFRKLNKRINKIPSVSTFNFHSLLTDEMDKRESVLMSKLTSMESELASLRATKDSTAIKFGRLGFRSQSDCTAWLQIHHPNDEFGLLVDFHLVMEHVFVQINGQKLLANLEKIYKMDLRSNNQALAISSFETRLPRFFSQDLKVHVKKDESYFHGIKSWDEWDLPNDGYRDRLNVELHLFKVGHKETLDHELEHLSPFHNLCVLALTESVAWVDSLIKFIDDTFNEYSRSRYGNKKAWHITTRLAKSLIDKVATPRNSVHNSFTIKRPSQVSKSIAYSSLRSLDLMMNISAVNFKNSPIITAELSKFLALNTNYEAVEQVQKKVTSIESDTLAMKKDVKSAISAANTAGNKWDSSIKPQLEDFKKRIRALEARN